MSDRGWGLGKETATRSPACSGPPPSPTGPPAPARLPSGPTVLMCSCARPWALPAAASTGSVPGAPSLTNSFISPRIPR